MNTFNKYQSIILNLRFPYSSYDLSNLLYNNKYIIIMIVIIIIMIVIIIIMIIIKYLIYK